MSPRTSSDQCWNQGRHQHASTCARPRSSAVNQQPSIGVVAISSPSHLASSILRGRAERAARPNARQFAARIDDKEAGYLSFEDRPDLALGVIYEVFVLSEFRSRGIGSALIRFGEDLARQAGYRRVRLYPRPTDDDVYEDRLVAGYARRGYRHCPSSGGEMEKVLERSEK
jgi:ribosomal protein S18 acetylase RimI-like enzyme